MNPKIIDAIENRNLLEFYYDGHYRLVEPHTYGCSSKGNDILSAYQIEGTSEEGGIPDWRLFTTSEIIGLRKTDFTFSGTRPKYGRGDSRMREIYIEL
jgi:hypothetical protein